MPGGQFDGNKKSGEPLLWHWEQRIIKKYTPKIPAFLNGYNLTLFNILWSILIIVFGFLAKTNIHWLWLVSVVIFLQWLTDSFDGAVARYRNLELVRWGYYMDHLFDYIFLCSILIAYSFILPDKYDYMLFFVLAIFGAFMVSSYLAFSASNELRMGYLKIGPTEARILFIIVNTLIIIFGRTYMAWALPYVLIFSFLGLCWVIYKTQKHIWRIDMKNKKS